MKLAILLKFSFLVYGLGCVGKDKDSALTFEFEYQGGDSCYYLLNGVDTTRASIRLEVLENTISDTIRFGLAVIPGGYRGRLIYYDPARPDGSLLYNPFETPVEKLPITNRFCIMTYPGRVAQGKIKIQVTEIRKEEE